MRPDFDNNSYSEEQFFDTDTDSYIDIVPSPSTSPYSSEQLLRMILPPIPKTTPGVPLTNLINLCPTIPSLHSSYAQLATLKVIKEDSEEDDLNEHYLSALKIESESENEENSKDSKTAYTKVYGSYETKTPALTRSSSHSQTGSIVDQAESGISNTPLIKSPTF